MATQPVSFTYTNSQTISIPSNAANVTVTVVAGRGGRGGNDADASGGGRGNGRIGSFTLSNFTGRNLTLSVGTQGPNAPSNCAVCRGSPGSGVASGGFGGYSGPNGSSGGGGGGGGATGVYDSFAGKWIIVAGGGGGGGGASYPGVTGLSGVDASNWNTGLSDGLISNGGTGGSQGNDGGGGGGGGGGAGGGGGGNAGADVSVGNIRAGGGGGGTSRYDSSYATLVNGSSSLNSSDASPSGSVTVSYTLYTPEIISFTASPNPQTSQNGTPNSNTTLTWDTLDANTASINQSVGTVSVDGSLTVNTGLQSIAGSGSTSPASKTYILTAFAGTVSTTRTLTVNVYNDNDPSTITLGSNTTVGTPLSSLEPNTQYLYEVGPINGIDMPTKVTCLTAGLDVSKTASAPWSNEILVNNGDTVYFRFFSLALNTDPSGLTNSKIFYFNIGADTGFNFTATTRAPDVNETFDFGDNSTNFPYPDIDIIANTPSQYLESPTTLTVDDIEIPVEIKVDQSDAEIRIKPSGSSTFGSWQTPRSI